MCVLPHIKVLECGSASQILEEELSIFIVEIWASYRVDNNACATHGLQYELQYMGLTWWMRQLHPSESFIVSTNFLSSVSSSVFKPFGIRLQDALWMPVACEHIYKE